MAATLFLILVLIAAMGLAIWRAPILVWAIGVAVATLIWQSPLAHGPGYEPSATFLRLIAWLPAILLAALSIPALRRSLLVEPAFRAVRKILPKVSDTEQQALDAGTVGFDAELFS